MNSPRLSALRALLRDRVRAALDVAADENDYVELVDLPAEEVADDLWDRTDEFEKFFPQDLVPYVAEWQANRRAAR